MVTRHTRGIVVHKIVTMNYGGGYSGAWQAVFEGYDIYDSTQPIGHGSTERDAIRDLLIAADMDDDK